MKKEVFIIVFSVFFLILISFVGSDEPEPQSVLYKRTATTEIWKNPDGTYTRTIGQGTQYIDDKTKRGYPNYVPFNETFFKLINSTNPLFDYELDQYYEPGWNVYFKENPTQGQVVKYIVNETEITFQPMALNYRNDLNQLQQISMIQSVVGINNTNKFTYSNAYGYGIDLNYENKLGMMKENLVINSFSNLPSPQQYILDGGNPTLDLDFIITTNSKMIINGVEWDKKNTATSQNRVQIQDMNGKTLYNLPTPIIRDSDGNEITGKYHFKKSGNSLYIIIKTPYSWLQNAVYPVYIDPTITLQDADTENLEDTCIKDRLPDGNYGSQTTLEVAWEKHYTGVNETDSSLIKFNIGSIIGQSILSINHSILYLYMNARRTAQTGIYVWHYYNQTWIETYPTYNNFGEIAQAGFNSTPVNLIGVATGVWTYANVTGFVSEAVDNSYRNITFFLNVSEYNVDTSIRSKEYITTSLRPYLNITYTPYIDIISPTPSEIETDDSPTFYFNVSTAVNMTLCYWTNDTGYTNYSMENVGSSNDSFYNSTTNFLIDGDHTIEFYCNQSDDGTWRTSDSISFDIDSVNVTVCRDLSVAYRNYTLLNNITTTGDCFDIKNNSITFDMNNQNITGDLGVGDVGISTDNSIYNITIKEGEIYSFWMGLGIGDTDNSNFTDLIISSNNYGINVFGDENIFSNLMLDSNVLYGIRLRSGKDSNFININISNTIQNVTISGEFSNNNSFINCSYNLSLEYVDTTSDLTRKWYFSTNITDLSNIQLNQANITIYNITGTAIHSELTGTSGGIGREEIIEYINDGGTKTYATPHTINVSKTGFITNSTEVNFTLEQNYIHRVLLTPSLSIDIDQPKPQVYTFNESHSLNYSITNYTTLDACWYYILNSTDSYEISNTTITNCVNTTFNVSIDDIYTIYLHVNETGGQEANDSVTFEISRTAPAVVLNYPIDNQIFDNETDIYFNFTATDSDDLSTCELYGNWTDAWHNNFTWIHPTNDTMNWTILNLTYGRYKWNVWCNDTSNNEKWALNNFTVTIDTIPPKIEIDYITTTLGSQTFQFNTTVIDLTSTICWYSIFNSSSGIDGLNENVSFTCNTETSATVTTFATFNLTVYTNDSANNENSSIGTFTTAPTPPLGPPSGGGGVSVIVVIGLVGNWTMETETGAGKYSFEMVAGSSRTKDILFQNLDIEEKDIILTCEDVNGSLCDHLEFERNNFTLPVQKEIKTSVSFTIILPRDIEKGRDVFNIVATDNLKRKGVLTVEVNVGVFGWFTEFFVKIGSSFLIKGVKFYYAFLFIFSLIVFSVVSYYLGFKKLPWSALWVILLSGTLSVLIIFLV